MLSDYLRLLKAGQITRGRFLMLLLKLCRRRLLFSCHTLLLPPCIATARLLTSKEDDSSAML